MTIEEHICKLLQTSNAVRIPGFGAIIATYAPARIHPAQHLFQPPHKALSFDKDLVQDDGVLTQYVSKVSNVSPAEAQRRILLFVNDSNESLKKTGNCLMPGIGRFYFDIEKQLQFIPDYTNNFLLASYGLSDFISHPILRPENIPSYATQPLQEKKRKRFIWFRF